MAASMQRLETDGNVLRKRKTDTAKPATKLSEESSDTNGEEVQTVDGKLGAVTLQTGTFWLTRIVLLRSIAFIYFVAFGVAYSQNKQLIGQRGLTPCEDYLRSVKRYVGGKIDLSALAYAPTLLWFLDWTDMDANLDGIALLGLLLSGGVLLAGRANMIIMALLWVLYHSLISVGQIWYSFGWESQLLETGFLGIFLCPLWSLSQVPLRCPPSRVTIWLFRWLVVRIMLGAGLIKIRGDRCWRDLTCMDYHYETQPVPNPMSYYMHRSPWWFHRFETLSNHFIELIAPLLTFLGRRLCMVNGVLQILFQVTLIVSGNLSFLNWLTIVPCLACFDDAALGFLFGSSEGGAKQAVSRIQSDEAAGRTPAPTRGMLVRRAVSVSLAVLIGYLSVPVVMNLLSSRQVMNTSFDPLRIVNTYGAFGSITKERTEVVFQGTLSSDPADPAALWEEYEFMCKPGGLHRRPCLISPYHYRLDWLMWFAAFQTYEQNEWVIHIAGRLLANDSSILSLLQHNPFQGRATPRWVRGEHFRYRFSEPGGANAAQGKWWIRKRLGAYFPPVDLAGLRKYFQSRNWPHPDVH
ncbi:lipase maturation factor 1 [Anguilla anguilla]|uniref:lipase maturation factor 1 n=1 Tax=Anguilla anguilla TaxID=7936 RepID=UPI0015AB99BC|nr:lipase maturation factor 1 [Anguilla anguilla]